MPYLAPIPVGPTMMNTLKSITVYQQPNLGMPAWATTVAYHRDDFKNTMFVHTFDAETTYWKFLYAIQSPSVYIAFSQATAIDIWLNSISDPARMQGRKRGTNGRTNRRTNRARMAHEQISVQTARGIPTELGAREEWKK